MAYGQEKVYEFLSRVSIYSREDQRNGDFNENRLWSCEEKIDLEKYAVLMKSAVKKNQKDENGNPFLYPEGSFIQKELTIKDAGVDGKFLIVELKNTEDKQRNWVYSTATV